MSENQTPALASETNGHSVTPFDHRALPVTKLRAYLYETGNGTRFLPRLLTAAEAAALVPTMTAERLHALAMAEALPHIRIDDGPPLFYEPDFKLFVRDRLTRHLGAEGPIPEPVTVYLTKPSTDLEIPSALAEYVGRLREVPLQAPLEQPCVYFLMLSEAVVYVGQSTNLFSRLGQHWRDGKRFERVLYLLVPPERLSAVEMQFIKALRPPLNATGVPKATPPTSGEMSRGEFG